MKCRVISASGASPHPSGPRAEGSGPTCSPTSGVAPQSPRPLHGNPACSWLRPTSRAQEDHKEYCRPQQSPAGILTLHVTYPLMVTSLRPILAGVNVGC